VRGTVVSPRPGRVRRFTGPARGSVRRLALDLRCLGTQQAVGAHVIWPFLPLDEGGTTVLQGWFDVRYAVPGARALSAGEGMVWTQLMLGVALRTDWRRR
jgi:hypothetical protein